MALTKEQLRAIHAGSTRWEQRAAIHTAKRSGLSKRDLFEFDVMLAAKERILKQEKDVMPFNFRDYRSPIPSGEVPKWAAIRRLELQREADSVFFGKPEFKLNPRGTSFLFRGRNPVKITQVDSPFGKGTLTEYTNKFTKEELEKIDAMERLEETGTKEEFLKTNMLERGNLELQ